MIVIVVEGGCVVDVYSSTEKEEVRIFDFDNTDNFNVMGYEEEAAIERNQKDEMEKNLEELTKDMFNVA